MTEGAGQASACTAASLPRAIAEFESVKERPCPQTRQDLARDLTGGTNLWTCWIDERGHLDGGQGLIDRDPQLAEYAQGVRVVRKGICRPTIERGKACPDRRPPGNDQRAVHAGVVQRLELGRGSKGIAAGEGRASRHRVAGRGIEDAHRRRVPVHRQRFLELATHEPDIAEPDLSEGQRLRSRRLGDLDDEALDILDVRVHVLTTPGTDTHHLDQHGQPILTLWRLSQCFLQSRNVPISRPERGLSLVEHGDESRGAETESSRFGQASPRELQRGCRIDHRTGESSGCCEPGWRSA